MVDLGRRKLCSESDFWEQIKKADAIQVVDGILFDIPLEQEEAPLQVTCKKGLRIDDLSDTAALKMICINWSQLRRLYPAFNLEGQLEPMQDKLAFPMGHFFDGTPCC
jgi:hypothetical protein